MMACEVEITCDPTWCVTCVLVLHMPRIPQEEGAPILEFPFRSPALVEMSECRVVRAVEECWVPNISLM